MLFIVIACFVLINAIIALYDFSFHRIPNIFLGALLVLFGFYAPLYLDFNTVVNSLIIFGVVFILSFGLYALKIVGAGDAKYITVISLWFGIHGTIPFLFLMSVAGGGLAVIYLIFGNQLRLISDWVSLKILETEAHYPPLQSVWTGSGVGPETGERASIGPRMVPYGIAIATGAIVTLIINPITH